MPTRLVWDGMNEFRAALKALPEDLRDDAGELARRESEAAKAAVLAAYPRKTGKLHQGVKLTHQPSRFGAESILRSRARHAHLWEFGTARGQRPRPTFIPIRERHQIAFRQGVIALVRNQGLTVMGS